MTLGTFTAAGRRLRLSLALAAALGGAAACGGGGDTVNSFDPQRLIVFGDEASVLSGPPATVPGPALDAAAPVGSKYSINALDVPASSTAPGEDLEPQAGDPANLGSGYGNCESNALWIQELASNYNFGFEQCKADRPVRAATFAVAGAKVAGVKAQIDAFLQSDRFGQNDLVAIYVGLNDILEIYAGVGSAGECRYDTSDPEDSGPAALAARRRGEALADQVSRVADGGNGGRVLFVTVPKLGSTPFARQQNVAHTDFDRRDCLDDLTDAFNGGLRATVLQDGRYVGLVALDEQVELIVDEPDDWDYDNVSEAACNDDVPSLLKCTTSTLKQSSRTYLWADALHFGPKLHERFGLLAERRAERNPF